jgi:ribosomal protein L11 methyltransferase
MRYDDWQDGAHAEPIVIGPLSILPPSYSSNDFSPKDLAINQFGYERSLPPIILDPGLAFGYGGHRTTMSCLNFLLRVYSPKNKRKPQSVIDIGSGTGILSFAASRLGATKVIGVDNSRIAVDIAEVNVKNNNLSDIVSFIYGEARIFATEEGELLIANVPFSAMVELIDNNAFLNRRYVILSGIFPEQADIILSKLKKNFKYKILDSERDERWTSLLMENKEK